MYKINAFLNYKPTKENILKMMSLTSLFVGAANTIAYNAMFEAKDMLSKRKDLWKHDVKYNANMAVEACEQFERLHKFDFADRYNLFLDYLSCIEEETQKHVNILEYTIMQNLTKCNQPDARLKAKVETARTLIEFSCHMYDHLMHHAKKQTGCDFSKMFAPTRLSKALNAANRLSDKVCRLQQNNDINLNDDPQCVLALEIIARTIADENVLNRASYNALKQNPDIVKEAVPEDTFRELQARFEIE